VDVPKLPSALIQEERRKENYLLVDVSKLPNVLIPNTYGITERRGFIGGCA
jgi:hypothetical protein